MSSATIAAMAAIAAGWIEEEAPVPLHSGMLARVDAWRDSGHQPLGALWHPIAEVLYHCGAYDAELAACRVMVSLEPMQPSFRLRLGQSLLRAGERDEGISVLTGLAGLPNIRIQALWSLLKAGDGSLLIISELERLLLDDGIWSSHHADLVKHWVSADSTERGAAFLDAWTERWTLPPTQIMDMAMMAMLVGRSLKARQLFELIWRGAPQANSNTVGRLDGVVRPYDQEIEAALVERIEEAFRRDEAELARVALPDYGPCAPSSRVVLLTFGDRVLDNDFAVHFQESAREVGVDLHVYVDSALTLPCEFIGSDSEVGRRLAAFEAEMERLRPDVVMIDCVSPLILRGINPAILYDLKQRLGFKAICLMRDSHRLAMPLVKAWLPACDAMMADILSPIFNSDHAHLNERVLPLVVPSLHRVFAGLPAPELGLVFVGGVTFFARFALLSILLTEEMDFTAIFGERRYREVPDMAAYAKVLGRAGAVLNLSIHTPEDHLVTGRVWETIAAGSLLVEQDNEGTASFFTPFRHYLPWRNAEDIVHIAHFIKQRPDLARRVAAEAHAWAQIHYNPKRLWGAMLGHASRSRPEADHGAERRAAHAWSAMTMG